MIHTFKCQGAKSVRGVAQGILAEQYTVVGVAQPSLCRDCAGELSVLIREWAGDLPFGGIYCPHTQTLAQVRLGTGRVERVMLVGPVEPDEADRAIAALFEDPPGATSHGMTNFAVDTIDDDGQAIH